MSSASVLVRRQYRLRIARTVDLKRYLYNRKRKARREYKRNPLFAFLIMVANYPRYSYRQFVADIKTREYKARAKKAVKRQAICKVCHKHRHKVQHCYQAQRLFPNLF